MERFFTWVEKNEGKAWLWLIFMLLAFLNFSAVVTVLGWAALLYGFWRFVTYGSRIDIERGGYLDGK